MMRITGSPQPQSEQGGQAVRSPSSSRRDTQTPALDTPPVRRDPVMSLFQQQEQAAAEPGGEAMETGAVRPDENARSTPELINSLLDADDESGLDRWPDPAGALAAMSDTPHAAQINSIVSGLLSPDDDRPSTSTDGPARLDPVERRLCAQLHVDGATLRTVRDALRLTDPKQPAHNVAAGIARHLRKPGHNVEIARQLGIAPLSVGKMRQALGINLSWSQTSYVYPDEPDGQAREVNAELAGSLNLRRSVVHALRHNIGLENPDLPAQEVLDGVTRVLRDYPQDDAAGRVMDIDRRTVARMREAVDHPASAASSPSQR